MQKKHSKVLFVTSACRVDKYAYFIVLQLLAKRILRSAIQLVETIMIGLVKMGSKHFHLELLQTPLMIMCGFFLIPEVISLIFLKMMASGVLIIII